MRHAHRSRPDRPSQGLSVSVVMAAALFIGRLLGGRRRPSLAPVRSPWLRTRSRMMAYVRSSPVTYAYLAILFATSWMLADLGDRRAERLLIAQSTNLENLGHAPVRVLISSAFWTPGRHDLLVAAVLFTFVLAPVERRIGSWRTVGVFAIGHIGATLLVAGGLWIALHLDAVEPSVAHARDVGTSYGFFAVAAAMTYLLARAVRLPYAVALVAYLSVAAASSEGFGDYGHLAAMALGFTAYPLVAPSARSRIHSPILDDLPSGRRFAGISERTWPRRFPTHEPGPE